ncbi:hypothetical protein MTO96_034820 [Rhipicephalus appendiculatus]
MASGSRQSPKTTNERSAEGTPQRELLENAAPCRSHQLFSGGPFLSFSGRSSGTVSQAASSSSTQGVPKKHDTAAAHVEFGSISHPSSRQSSVVSSFRDVHRLSPVYSSDDDRWSPRSMSLLFSQSTFGYEFDHASLSHRVSSVAEDRRMCADVGPCQRYTLMMFLVAVLVACVTAVVVDMRWTALSRNRWTHLLVDPNLPAVASPVEGNASVQRTTHLSRTTVTTVEPSSSAKERAAIDEWTTLDGPDDNATVAPDVQEETAVIMKITQPPTTEGTLTSEANTTLAPTRTAATLSLRPLTTKRRSTQRSATLRREDDFHSRRNVLSAPIRRPTKHKCGLAFYTYCLTFRHEAYYRHTTRSCVRTIMDDVHVCNHSPNRFTSHSECEKKCVHTRVTSDACFENTLFSWCNRQDVNASWWVFDGKRCRPWDFPRGRCPSPDDSDIFGSLDECVRRCSSPQVLDDNDRRDKCKGPGDGVTCDTDILRFPYFADVSPGADGHVRCVRASAATLLTHRCLIGSNRFSSDEACKRACVDGATLRRGMKGGGAK